MDNSNISFLLFPGFLGSVLHRSQWMLRQTMWRNIHYRNPLGRNDVQKHVWRQMEFALLLKAERKSDSCCYTECLHLFLLFLYYLSFTRLAGGNVFYFFASSWCVHITSFMLSFQKHSLYMFFSGRVSRLCALQTMKNIPKIILVIMNIFQHAVFMLEEFFWNQLLLQIAVTMEVC